MAASTLSVRTSPRAGNSRNPVNKVPAMPPSVLQASTAPASRPTCRSPTAIRSTAGNAAPSSSVGANTRLAAATAKRAHMPAKPLPVHW
jgi:hypothetical protein